MVDKIHYKNGFYRPNHIGQKEAEMITKIDRWVNISKGEMIEKLLNTYTLDGVKCLIDTYCVNQSISKLQNKKIARIDTRDSVIYVSYLNDGTKIRAIRIYNEGYYEERVYVDDQLLLIKKSEALYKLKRLSWSLYEEERQIV